MSRDSEKEAPLLGIQVASLRFGALGEHRQSCFALTIKLSCPLLLSLINVAAAAANHRATPRAKLSELNLERAASSRLADSD